MSSGKILIDNYKNNSSKIGDDITIELLEDNSILLYSDKYYKNIANNNPCYEDIFHLIYNTHPIFCINEINNIGIIFHEMDESIYYFDLINNVYKLHYSFKRNDDRGLRLLYYYEYNNQFIISCEIKTFCFNINNFELLWERDDIISFFIEEFKDNYITYKNSNGELLKLNLL
jgi:hypothetical protein